MTERSELSMHFFGHSTENQLKKPAASDIIYAHNKNEELNR